MRRILETNSVDELDRYLSDDWKIISGAGSYKNTPFETDEIGTDVIAKVHGHWICVLTQLTTITKH